MNRHNCTHIIVDTLQCAVGVDKVVSIKSYVSNARALGPLGGQEENMEE